MDYKVVELFDSWQGEGEYSGTPAWFIRLSGCNLNCPFCDTQHENYTLIDEEEVVKKISRGSHVVITGGEPLLHDLSPLIKRLQELNAFIQIETNGTLPPEWVKDGLTVDQVTISPKNFFVNPVILGLCNELKFLVGQPFKECIKLIDFYMPKVDISKVFCSVMPVYIKEDYADNILFTKQVSKEYNINMTFQLQRHFHFK